MSDEPETTESLDDIMASLEAAPTKAKLTSRYPMSTGPNKTKPSEPTPLPAPQPVEALVHNMTEADYDLILKEIDDMGKPAPVEQYAEYDAEPVVIRAIPMPTGWILPLAALLMSVLVLGGLGLYVWSHTP